MTEIKTSDISLQFCLASWVLINIMRPKVLNEEIQKLSMVVTGPILGPDCAAIWCGSGARCHSFEGSSKLISCESWELILRFLSNKIDGRERSLVMTGLKDNLSSS